MAHFPSLMHALSKVGLVAPRQGDLPKVLPLLERAMSLCQDLDLLVWCPQMAAPLGTAYIPSGRIIDAVALLTKALKQSTAMARARNEVPCHLVLGEALTLAGRLKEVQVHAEHALALARGHQERGEEVSALHLLGEIATQRQPTENDQAGDDYRQALALAEALGMRPLQAHCHLGLGNLYATIGRRTEARTELSTAVELYRAMDMTLPECADAVPSAPPSTSPRRRGHPTSQTGPSARTRAADPDVGLGSEAGTVARSGPASGPRRHRWQPAGEPGLAAWAGSRRRNRPQRRSQPPRTTASAAVVARNWAIKGTLRGAAVSTMPWTTGAVSFSPTLRQSTWRSGDHGPLRASHRW